MDHPPDMAAPRVNVAVCGRFHYHNYIRFLDATGMLNRFYYAAKLSINGRSLGLDKTKAINGFFKEYAVFLHSRVLEEFWRVPAYSVYHDLWQRYMLHHWSEAGILHVLLHGNTRLMMTRARAEGAIIIGEPVNSHPNDLRELLNSEYRRLGIKTVLVEDKIERRLADEAMQCDWLLAGSSFVRDSFVRHGFPSERTAVIPYGTAGQYFSPVTAGEVMPPPAGLRPARFRVICVAQIVPRKGHIYLLEAWRRLALPDAELVFIGRVASTMKPVLARYEGSFTHLDHVPNTQLRQYYVASDLFAMGSIEDGFGYVCAEAMACGLPVITTMNTGAAELLEEGVNGFKVPICSVEAFMEKFELLYRDRTKLQEMSRAALATAGPMGWDDYAKKLAVFYRYAFTTTRTSAP